MLIRKYYEPSDSMEDYDTTTGIYYNSSGTPLRNPEEYNTSSEGYTSFGDE